VPPRAQSKRDGGELVCDLLLGGSFASLGSGVERRSGLNNMVCCAGWLAPLAFVEHRFVFTSVAPAVTGRQLRLIAGPKR
jgi:hypothetical protein